MKHLLLFSVLSTCIFQVHAQMGLFSRSQDKSIAVDTARYKVTYRLDYTCHPSADKRFDDVRTLLIGHHKVKDFSDIIFHYDSLMTADLRRGADVFSNPKGSPWPYEIVLSPREKTADMKYRLPDMRNVLHYTENLPELKWEFNGDSMRNILGYDCNIATTEFAGRKYTAWFTPEIPLPYGPYKFGGLPGLIMQLQDSAGQFVWESIGLEKSDDPIVIYEYEDEKKCTAAEAAKTIKRCFNSPIAAALATFGGGKGKVMIVGKDGKVRDAADVEDTPIPYEPIELCDF